MAILIRVGIDDVVAGFADGGAPDAEARLISATLRRRPRHVASTCRTVARSTTTTTTTSSSWLGAAPWPTSPPRPTPADDVVVVRRLQHRPRRRDVYDPAKFVGTTHVSPPEREALAALERVGPRRRLPPATTTTGSFSWWDYRAGDFHEGRGMRIDLVLATAPVAAARRAGRSIDRNARKGKQPSDHAPVVVDLDWPPA